MRKHCAKCKRCIEAELIYLEGTEYMVWLQANGDMASYLDYMEIYREEFITGWRRD